MSLFTSLVQLSCSLSLSPSTHSLASKLRDEDKQVSRQMSAFGVNNSAKLKCSLFSNCEIKVYTNTVEFDTVKEPGLHH